MIKQVIKIENSMPINQAIVAKFYNVMIAKNLLTEAEALEEYENDRKSVDNGGEWK